MSENEPEKTTGISDDQLPPDLVPGEDNPLAEGLDPDEADPDLLAGGKLADEMDQRDQDDQGDATDEQQDGASS